LVEHSQRQIGPKGTKKAFLGEARAKGKRAKSRLAQACMDVNGLNKLLVNIFVNYIINL